VNNEDPDYVMNGTINVVDQTNTPTTTTTTTTTTATANIADIDTIVTLMIPTEHPIT
jgi:hypothetical protein